MHDHEFVSQSAVAHTVHAVAQSFLLQQARTIAATVPAQSVTPQVLNLEEVLDLAPPTALTIHAAGIAAGPAESEHRLGRYTTRPALGSPELPSLGSLGHNARRCKPCAFATRDACANGTQCNFCHLCSRGEKKRRRKEKQTLLSAPKLLLARSGPQLQVQKA
jgi:hypothetical protein